MSCIMTDARPHLSKAELSHALRKLKGFSADLETKSGYEASAILISEIMADPAQRDQLVVLLEQYEESYPEVAAARWVNDGLPFDRSAKSSISDDLYQNLPMGSKDGCQVTGSTFAFIQNFLNKYKEEMIASRRFVYGAPVTSDVYMSPRSQYVLREPIVERKNLVSFNLDAWSQVLHLAKQRLQDKATRRPSLLSRLAQVFYRDEPPEWEVEKCPVTKDSLLVILHHGKDHASIGFIGNGQSAYVMVSISDTALTMNESFQNTQKFAARIADFFIECAKIRTQSDPAYAQCLVSNHRIKPVPAANGQALVSRKN